MAVPNGNPRGLTERQQAEVDAEWQADSDGMLHRDAARVILIDRRGESLLIRGHDIGDPGHTWWFTVGGGITPSESAAQGACRELEEETGLKLSPDRLRGPVLKRRATFHFALETRRQDELFYFASVTANEREAVGRSQHLTALEQDVLDEFRWWSPQEILRAQGNGETFYPHGIAGIIQRLNAGWDGSCPELEEE